jgi:hypothetical protein
MLYGIKTVTRYLLGTDIAGRNFAVYPDDTLLVSYPRSGNTWTRFLIANMLHPALDVSFANIEKLVPDTSSQSNRALKRIPRPRIIKTHEYFDHRYRRVIYIVRDPRDVAVSYYNFQRKYRQIDDTCSMERFVENFVAGKMLSADWGSWGENVGSWLSTRSENRNFLLCRYEDMQADLVRELTRVAIFLGVEPDPLLLEQSVQRSSADHMRAMEKRQSDRWVATKGHRKDIPFVGGAKSGGWKQILPETSALQIEDAWGEWMRKLDYELVGRGRSPLDASPTIESATPLIAGNPLLTPPISGKVKA